VGRASDAGLGRCIAGPRSGKESGEKREAMAELCKGERRGGLGQLGWAVQWEERKVKAGWAGLQVKKKRGKKKKERAQLENEKEKKCIQMHLNLNLKFEI
jgi:hypothetical protein